MFKAFILLHNFSFLFINVLFRYKPNANGIIGKIFALKVKRSMFIEI